ncbi:hypothetical protein IMCC20628_03856 [Hoeflea sp. IMCC20628]|uniref:hypothetical protein n=1 Tax=Hoeflea sp. IMCC20628 TaxID=1620421 RepID=UPI00063AE65C|nr:hypothetical protein [Hoeflea sp. IMCC20628]AKI02538.1 hypothetical protein IMCC20628_03856 [Hoeflea sp. IMCC20628]
MLTRTRIALLIALPVNAVLFGAGAIAVLSIPALADHAKYLLPAVVVTGLLATAPVAWLLAPRLRARHQYPGARRSS